MADLAGPAVTWDTYSNSLRQIEPSSKVHLQWVYSAILIRDGDWWIGWVEEVPGVNAQERSREELLASLRAILAEALEFNRKRHAQQLKVQHYSEQTFVFIGLTVAILVPVFTVNRLTYKPMFGKRQDANPWQHY